MSVSNALTALAKRNQVRREGGKYYPGSHGQGEAELPLDDPEGNRFPKLVAERFRTEDRAMGN